MVLATANKSKQLLYLNYIGTVRPEELRRSQNDIQLLLAELPDGFRVLADLSALVTMDLDCMTEIGRLMEMIDRSGVGLIVRVIPDPAKDIGLNIFSIFHYPRRPQIATCKNMSEAGELLRL